VLNMGEEPASVTSRKIIKMPDNNQDGLLRNLSEALELARRGGIEAIIIGYMRKDEQHSVRTYCYNTKRAEFNLLLDITKGDLLAEVWEDEEIAEF